MGKIRKIKKVLKSIPTLEGAGVHLKRAFGFSQKPQLDPFLLLDDFHSGNPAEYIKGFPWHPHRGIETITYLLQGSVEHGDSLGNEGVIAAGDVQWMTAGSGIIHQEMPKGDKEGIMWGLQLWANLPASHKMITPRYRDITHQQIPEVKLDNGVQVKIVAGEIQGTKGPVQDIVIGPAYLDVAIPPGEIFIYKVPSNHTLFAYVLQGNGYFEPERDPYGYEIIGKNYFDFKRECLVDSGTLVIYERGEQAEITAADEAMRFLLISGKPIGEPIAWYGPIVMNSHAELRTAFEEFQNGTFLKHQTKQ
jgi:redox-sensitive bicupin YhaK (pirin superfamily)